jgi:hypothetical protein
MLRGADAFDESLSRSRRALLFVVLLLVACRPVAVPPSQRATTAARNQASPPPALRGKAAPACREMAFVQTVEEMEAEDGLPTTPKERASLEEGVYVWPGPSLFGSGRVTGRALLGSRHEILERRGDGVHQAARIASPPGWIAASLLVRSRFEDADGKPCGPGSLAIAADGVALAEPREGAEQVLRVTAGEPYQRGEERDGWVRLADAPVEAWVRAEQILLERAAE